MLGSFFNTKWLIIYITTKNTDNVTQKNIPMIMKLPFWLLKSITACEFQGFRNSFINWQSKNVWPSDVSYPNISGLVGLPPIYDVGSIIDKAKAVSNINTITKKVGLAKTRTNDDSIGVVLLNRDSTNHVYNLCIENKVIHDNLDSHAIVSYLID